MGKRKANSCLGCRTISTQNLVTFSFNYVAKLSVLKLILHPKKYFKAMKTIQVKTNIMCGSCITKVTPVLNETFGEDNWKVDTQNPKKTLTVLTESNSENDVIKAVEKAGYKAEELV
jgi:copper chaperone